MCWGCNKFLHVVLAVLVFGVECDDARGLRVRSFRSSHSFHFQSCFESVEGWVG